MNKSEMITQITEDPRHVYPPASVLRKWSVDELWAKCVELGAIPIVNPDRWSPEVES
jgi:hypothetical protein